MKNLTIISDFSKTLSSGDKGTTWSMLADSGTLGLEYNRKREELYYQYHGFELSGNQQKTREWFKKHLELIVASGLTKKNIQSVIHNSKYIEGRKGLEEFIYYIEKYGIGLIIITSGIVNFVEVFLDSLGIDRTNIQIFGNELEFNSEGICIDYKEKSIFSPLDDKSIFDDKLIIDPLHKIILLGDKKEDLAAYNSADITIGFCKEQQGYDYEFGKYGDFKEVINIIEKM